jgi:hypothetical protein
MSTRFTTTGKDKLQQLEVTRQTGLVVTDAKTELAMLNIATLMERLRNNPVELLEILERIRNSPLRGAMSLIKGLKNNLLGDLLGLKESALQSVIERLLKIINDRTIISGLTENQLLDLLSLLERSENRNRHNTIDYNGSITQYAPDDYEKAQQLLEAVRALDPEATISQNDILGQEAIFTVLAVDAVTLNANQIAIDLILKVNDPITRERLLNDSAYNAVLNGNIEYLNLLLDHPVLGYTKEKFKAMLMNWKQVILANYRFPPGTTANDHATLLTSLLALMSRLAQGDATQWFYYIRKTSAGDSTAFDLSIFSTASKDAITLIMLSPILRHCAMMSEWYLPVDLIGLSKKHYPYALI